MVFIFYKYYEMLKFSYSNYPAFLFLIKFYLLNNENENEISYETFCKVGESLLM